MDTLKNEQWPLCSGKRNLLRRDIKFKGYNTVIRFNKDGQIKTLQ